LPTASKGPVFIILFEGLRRNKLKRISLPVLGLVIISLILVGCSGTGTARSAGQAAKIRIGVDPKLPPFEVIKSNANDYTGFDIDLMRAIAEKSGFEFEFFNAGGNLITLVGQCKLDAGISALPMMDLFLEQIDFSAPYYTAGLAIVVKNGNTTIMGRDQLAGMKVGVQAGSVSELEIQKIKGAQPKVYETLDMAFQNLTNGFIDAVFADRPRALSYASVKRNNLKIVGAEFSGVDYGIATCKARTDLLEQINNGLTQVYNDGTLDKLAQKWGLSGAK
jgi:ABC-type amino acid transport substrate-binding protein